MKKMLSLLLTITMLTAVLPLQALADTLRLPNALTLVEASAFEGDDSLIEADLPWGVEVIESRAFANSGLTSVYIPGTVYSIAKDAFDDTVTFLCPTDSYARYFAQEQGLQWSDCGDHYGTEHEVVDPETAEELLEELEPLSSENMDLEAAELFDISSEDNEAFITLLQELNILVEQANTETETYNSDLQQMYTRMEDLYATMSSLIYSESDQAASFQLDGLQMELDTSLQNGISVITGEGGEFSFASADGSPYTVTMENGVLHIMNASRGNTTGGGWNLAISDSWWENINTVISAISNTVDLALEKLTDSVRDVSQNIDMWEKTKKQISTWFSNYIRTEEYERLGVIKQGELKERVNRKISTANKQINAGKARLAKLRGWQKALGKLNVGLATHQLLDLYDQYRRLKRIYDHGHPTEEDDYPEAIEDSRLLNTNIRFLNQALAVDAGLTVTSFLSAVAAIISAAGLPPVAAGLAVTSWLAAIGGMALNAKENELWAKVNELHGNLHCSISGTVLDEKTHKPLSGVAVSRDGKTAIATTDASGNFEVFLPRAVASLVFLLEDYTDGHTEFSLTPYESTYRIVYMKHEIATLYGQVLDDETSGAISGATVTCGDVSVTTDSSGNFEMEVKPDHYDVYAASEGYARQPMSVTLAVGDETKLIFRLHHNNAIHNREELEAVALEPDRDYYIANDFDLGDDPWTPLPEFTGSLDGKGYTISGMIISGEAEGYTGLFASLSDADLHHLTLDGVDINVTNSDKVGGLAGTATDSTVESCQVNGVIRTSGCQYIGGLLGTFTGSRVTACQTGVTIISEREFVCYVGGLAGSAESSTVTDISAICDLSLKQTGDSDVMNYTASGVGDFATTVEATRCTAGGEIRVETGSGRAFAVGLRNVSNGENCSDLTVVTQSGPVFAYGCWGGSQNVNIGTIKATSVSGLINAYGCYYATQCRNLGAIDVSSASSLIYACGLSSVRDGSNEADVTATCTEAGNSKTVYAVGAYWCSGSVTNTGTVSAENINGDAVAYGINGGYSIPLDHCTNAGEIIATSGSENVSGGHASATGIVMATNSRNSGRIQAQGIGSSNSFACGLSNCTYSANTGNIESSDELEDNYAHSSSAVAINGGSHNANYGTVTVRSRGWAEPTGLYLSDHSLNEGDVIAYGEHAVAIGMYRSEQSLNTATIMAVGRTHASAYGNSYYEETTSVSTGLASAECLNYVPDYYYLSMTSQANAWYSLDTKATLAGHTISASNGSEKKYYCHTGSCKAHPYSIGLTDNYSVCRDYSGAISTDLCNWRVIAHCLSSAPGAYEIPDVPPRE